MKMTEDIVILSYIFCQLPSSLTAPQYNFAVESLPLEVIGMGYTFFLEKHTLVVCIEKYQYCHYWLRSVSSENKKVHSKQSNHFTETQDGARTGYLLESMPEDEETIGGKLESFVCVCV